MKAILILPEMPSGCVECILFRMNVDGEIACAASAGNPGPCPLREMPERREEEWIDYAGEYARKDYRAVGWNDCLRAIEGSEEDG